MNYLMYLRKSRADGDNETIEEVLFKHERDLQNFSIRMFGSKIPEENIFREVVSGETIEDRPEVQKVLSLIESDDIKGVLVIDPQRLSRGDWEDGGKILSTFKYSNTLILTPPKTYDLNNKFDYKFFKMELSQGNEYLEYIKEILMRGRVSSINAGNYIGSVAPYGYDKTFAEKSPTLKPNAREAEAINIAIKKLVYDGLGWTQICRDLESMGYKPRKGEHWTPYTLRDICINPVNIGKIKWNTRKIVKVFEDGKLKKKRPRNKNDVIYVDGKHPAIVDVELFNKLIEKVGKNTREKSSSELVNPFAGLIFCGTCGRAMTYRMYKNKDGTFRSAPRLLCTNQVYCKTKSATFSEIYNSVIAILEGVVKDFEVKIDNDDYKAYNIQTRMLKEAEEELKKLAEKQEELYDFLEDKIYSKEVFLDRSAKLNAKREEVEKRIEFLKLNTIEPIDYKQKILMFSDVIDALKNDDVPAKYKNNLLKTIISRIDYYRESENRTKWDTSEPRLEIHLKDF